MIKAKEIKEIHDYHEHIKIKTAFTHSTHIIPLDYTGFQPWTQHGFTITTWINIAMNKNRKLSEQSNEQHSKSHKTHILSIGSNKLLLSIYLHSQDKNTLYFQLTRPSTQISEKKIESKQSSTTSSSDISAGSSTSKCVGKEVCSCLAKNCKVNNVPSVVPIQREFNMNHRRMDSLGHKDNIENVDTNGFANNLGLNAFSNTCQSAIRTTRIALRNSLTQFNLLPSSSTFLEDEYLSFRYPLEVRGMEIPKNKWTHLSFSVIPQGKEIMVK